MSQATNDRAYMDLLFNATENDLLRAQNPVFMGLYDTNRKLESHLSAQKYSVVDFPCIYALAHFVFWPAEN